MNDDGEKITIRVGKELFEDVRDYVLVVRHKDNTLSSQASSDSWAVGAMEGLLIDIQARRQHDADSGCHE